MDASSFDGLSFTKYMLSGATAGIAEHIAMYPVDTVKTRMQALAHPGQRLHGVPLHEAVAAIVHREGFLSLYRGIGAVALSAGCSSFLVPVGHNQALPEPAVMLCLMPAHALYFATYEVAKEALGVQRSSHAPVATAVAGASATVVNDALMTPGDVVKQRLQIANSPYKGLLDCVIQTYRAEGLSAFYRSYKLTLLMNVPFTAVHFSAYETAKKALATEDDENLGVQLVAGGFAGGLSAAVTNPLDVIKTRLQTDGLLRHRRRACLTAKEAFSEVVKREGYQALLHGLSARVLFHVPAAAVCWGTYESMKSFFVS